MRACKVCGNSCQVATAFPWAVQDFICETCFTWLFIFMTTRAHGYQGRVFVVQDSPYEYMSTNTTIRTCPGSGAYVMYGRSYKCGVCGQTGEAVDNSVPLHFQEVVKV